ncbi:hypothetical protein J6590_039830 [Homalodisca vitripennis]|nr:hypothetical protein J6590_039830 [Homalodisca vitripennis]
MNGSDVLSTLQGLQTAHSNAFLPSRADNLHLHRPRTCQIGLPLLIIGIRSPFKNIQIDIISHVEHYEIVSKRILSLQIRQSKNWELQRDNAPTHKSQLVQQYLDRLSAQPPLHHILDYGSFGRIHIIKAPHSPPQRPKSSKLKGCRFQDIVKIHQNVTSSFNTCYKQ